MADQSTLKKWLVVTIIFTAVIIFLFYYYHWLKRNIAKNTPSPTPTIKTSLTQTKIVRVIDGDTIIVDMNGKNETIRLIGIDAPEIKEPGSKPQCFSQEATDKAKEILTNKNVNLEADPTQGERDKYERLLRYVFLTDGTNFNQLMIADGLALEYTYMGKKYKYYEDFKAAENPPKKPASASGQAAKLNNLLF